MSNNIIKNKHKKIYTLIYFKSLSSIRKCPLTSINALSSLKKDKK